MARVIANPVGVFRSTEPAVKELAALGAEAAKAIRSFDGSELPDGVYPVDASDALIDVLREVAKRDAEPLLSGDDLPSIFALGSATPTPAVIGRLALLLREGEAWPRYAAASSPIEIATPEAAEALLPAFSDRSSTVQFSAVEAATTKSVFRRPEILPALKKIMDSERIRGQWPGTWERARDLVGWLERSATADR